MTDAPLAFRMVGGADNPRRLVDARKAWSLYAAADSRVQPSLPAFLSAFTFPKAFKQHLDATGSTAGYAGSVGAPFVHFDLDRDDLDDAVRDARKLAAFLVDRLDLDADDLVISYSGSKGFHVSIPMPPMEAAEDNHTVAKAFACRLADEVGIDIDQGVYDRVRPFRAPNSRHRKTGLFKVRLDLDDLLYLDADKVRRRAVEPIPFDLPSSPSPLSRLADDWRTVAGEVRRQSRQRVEVRRQVGSNTGGRITPSTRDLMLDPVAVEVGSRHARLFSAAANLAEFGTVEDLIVALLTGPGLDTGLPPREVIRQIQCGIEHARRQSEGDAA
ncbi:hypothetical protein [Tautonia rosea]|uniref:hypothetical protein n=1 Tax=Tautonia rosea TaxID=2728037 RepID=UPI00147414FD|nr:hypothetical protein [Tautonia rosea]